MRFETAIALSVAVLLAGCELTRTAQRYPPGTKIKPVEIITEEGEKDEVSPELAARLQQQQEAAEAMAAEASANVAAETPPSPAPQSAGPPAIVAQDEPPAEPVHQEGLEDKELTVDELIGLLGKKESRTPQEEEAYMRLLGLAAAAEAERPRGPIADLLAQAREALARGEYETAQGHLRQALELLRAETDPHIDRLVFARAVYSYGNAQVIADPQFKAGQLVMVVTDLSDFACLPLSGDGSPRRYRTKMTHRLAIYDGGGVLYWQESYGPFEYQADGYVATMFLPRKLHLPSNLKAGKYIMKAEVVDDLAGRQTQASVEFSVR